MYGVLVMKRIFIHILFILLVSLPCGHVKAEEDPIICGVANGFPPYQFKDKDGVSTGIDVELMKRIAHKLGRKVEFYQAAWDTVVTNLRLGRLDCVSGMEINKTRRLMFDFTEPVYSRKVAVFTLDNNTEIQSLMDLKGEIITGDRHSYVELHFSDLGLTNQIRIHQAKSKDQSMNLLVHGEAVAMIAPKAVAYYLAGLYGVKLRILDDPDPGSPVGVAVGKGNSELHLQIQSALDELTKEGELESLLSKWNLQ